MCKVDGCRTPPVKVQLVRLDFPVLLKDFCRPHYVEYARAKGTLVRCEVIGHATIVSADGTDTSEGGFVLLNTEETDVQMLVDLGFVGEPAPETVPTAKAEKAKA
ncbi:MAG TPA: hypothetical protein VFC19_49265 [Candidatus Limnocylindrales bacterium]|nr:hypothetical protein [Candidatus Limnocylindrales bacterium]